MQSFSSRRSSRWALAIFSVLLAAPSPARADDRSTELLRYECRSTLGRRDVTLFANGTVRLRQGLWEQQELRLDELRGDELESTLVQLREIQDSGETPTPLLIGRAPEGDWVGLCEIRLALPEAEPAVFSFSSLAVTPLIVSRLIHVAERLAGYTQPLDRAPGLPADYRPRRGDILRNRQGERFRVVGLTADNRGVELTGIDSPLTIFVALEHLRVAFATLEESGGGG